jgi:predicted ATPase/class 3 adenylate cyclase
MVSHHDAVTDTASPVAASPSQRAVQEAPVFGEHRIATLLCCALTALDAEYDQSHHGTPHRHAHVFYDRVRQVGARYGGTVQPVAGAYALIVFGTPIAQEDHAQRAVYAATDLLHAHSHRGADAASSTHKLAMHLSIHTGSIIVEGRREAGDATLLDLGTTAVVALALQKHCPSGTILCSETTARLIRRTVRLTKLAPVPVDGHAMLIQAYRIVTHDAQRAAVPVSVAWTNRPLVGRAQDLATLYTRWTQSEEGHGQVVGIVGEPGMGKSRLLYEFRRGLGERPHTYVQGRCFSFGRHSPYLPWLDVLRRIVGITPAEQEAAAATIRQGLLALGLHPEDDVPYLVHLLRPQDVPTWGRRLSPEARKTHTSDSFLRLIWQVAQRGPLVLEIENLHCIDATSEALLAALVERLAGLPILLVVTHRPGYCAPWMGKSYVTQIALTGLTPAESRRVVQAVLGARRIPDPLLHDIISKADGNPFFLEELTRAVVYQEQHAGTLTIPDTIQTVLASRIDQLPLATKRLLQIAAVIGAQVPVALLGAITSVSAEVLQHHLRTLQAAEFLTETGLSPHATYVFKQALIRHTAYQSLLPRTRQHYHRQIAQALTTQFPDIVKGQPERLAYHCTEGGLYEDAVMHWEHAGHYARHNGANVEAVQHYTRGLELLRCLPDAAARDQRELTLQTGYGTAMAATKGLAAPEVEQAFTRAHTLCQQIGDTPQLFPVLWGLRIFYMARGDLRTAHAMAQTLFERARQQQDPGPLLVSHQALGVALYYLGDLRAAQGHFEQMRTLYAPQHYADQADPWVINAVAVGFCYDALVLWHLGYLDRSHQRSQEALSLLQETSDPFCLAPGLFLIAVLHRVRREVELVRQHAETLISLATAKGFQYRLAQGMMLHGWSMAMQGQTAEGIAQIRQGLAVYEATGAQQERYVYLMCLADVYTHTQQFEAAWQTLTEALTASRHTEQPLGEARLYRRQGELLLAQATRGRHASAMPAEAAEPYLRRALDIAHNLQAKSLELRAAMSLSRLWQGQKKYDQAHDLLTSVYAWFTEGFGTTDLQEARSLLATLTAACGR